LSKRPATKSPLVLDWTPVFADIAQSGEFGYTTGPYTMKDTRPQPAPTRHGFYFSIWKRQADGSWKVVLDLGNKTPEPKEKYQLTAAPKGRINKALITPDLAPVRDELLALDRKFFDVAKSAGTDKAFFAFVRDDVRIHRDGRLPMTGTKSLRAYVNEKPFEITGSPITSDVARSADLGYTYGSYELKWAGAQKPEKGYYVRIWKRAPNGKWQIALDTITTVPEN
jgi:ketosteroid isomerase-like protein